MFRTMFVVVVLLVCLCVSAFAGIGGSGLSLGVLSANGSSNLFMNTTLVFQSQQASNLTFSLGWGSFTEDGRDDLQVYPLMLNIESKPTSFYFGGGAGLLARESAEDSIFDQKLHSEFGYQVFGGLRLSSNLFLEGKMIGSSGLTMYAVTIGSRM